MKIIITESFGNQCPKCKAWKNLACYAWMKNKKKKELFIAWCQKDHIIFILK